MTVKEITQYIFEEHSDIYHLPEQILVDLKLDSRVAVKKLYLRIEAYKKRKSLEEERLYNLFDKERNYWANGCSLIAGVDEAGRGPLAGPVVAAAVVFHKAEYIQGLNDSKKISEAKRYSLEQEITEKALCYGVGIVGNNIIDEINISNAGFLAMKDAINSLSMQPGVVLVDGFEIPQLPFEQIAIIKGDQHCASIAAASILAKCTRDRLMLQFHRQFPQYGFDLHKGYGTQYHYEALKIYGISPIHRKSFLG
ncbi:MAG: ribonuclease HII [Clostridia bacterium]|nr:ribonuclease HII [Clostridia bacterium]